MEHREYEVSCEMSMSKSYLAFWDEDVIHLWRLYYNFKSCWWWGGEWAVDFDGCPRTVHIGRRAHTVHTLVGCLLAWPRQHCHVRTLCCAHTVIRTCMHACVVFCGFPGPIINGSELAGELNSADNNLPNNCMCQHTRFSSQKNIRFN